MSEERGLMTLEDTMTLGEVFAKSGYFDDAKSQAQAVVKIMAGRELGLPPIASMMGINIIQGKPALGSNLIAATVKGHPRYDYKVKQADNEGCVLEWFETGQLVGESSFTMAEARTVKYYEKGEWKILAEKWNWQNYPSDMLFARAMTRGQKRYAPDLGGGAPIYTVEELNGEAERGDVIDVTPTPVTEDPAPTEAAPKKQQPARTTPADALDDTPTISTPPEFLAALKPLEYYNHGKHALNTLNKVDGTDLTTWPLNDPQFYAKALETLTLYANEQRALDKENAKDVISEAANQARF